MTTAFQINAFQLNAFQITGATQSAQSGVRRMWVTALQEAADEEERVKKEALKVAEREPIKVIAAPKLVKKSKPKFFEEVEEKHVPPLATRLRPMYRQLEVIPVAQIVQELSTNVVEDMLAYKAKAEVKQKRRQRARREEELLLLMAA